MHQRRTGSTHKAHLASNEMNLNHNPWTTLMVQGTLILLVIAFVDNMTCMYNSPVVPDGWHVNNEFATGYGFHETTAAYAWYAVSV